MASARGVMLTHARVQGKKNQGWIKEDFFRKKSSLFFNSFKED
jgi:hypothetical protein